MKFSGIALCLLIVATPVAAIADKSNYKSVCQLIKIEKNPTAYLLDKNNNLSKGPIDLGNIPIAPDFEAGEYVIETGYHLVVAPASLKKMFDTPNGYGSQLLNAIDICPHSKTYKVVITWNFKKGGVRPFKFEDGLTNFYRTVDGFDMDVENIYRNFDARIFGTLIEPKK